ncbi:hypothetical protein FNO01nite_03210 [Flavobacterium noncentrifugens]|uniref:DUF1579 domain-containing protein n=2 Tax=Flavobacterium noncentrifugens TaxID=1128970 RepID=A0A1G8S037_9FLAO|nr:hypothetical protein FNO01nite_03210 [Flavobacterium noncentrifugens]SDJ22576.1 Protein of unknown function [Flavobacterium noncentrifugens]
MAALLLMTVACKKNEEKAAYANAGSTDTTTVKSEAAEAVVPMDSAAMEKAWIAYATPGEAHKMLAMDNGNWDEDLTMWMKPNDPKPMKTKMTASSKMVLGGRYQEMVHKGTMMGQSFEGHGTVAYNNASKKIESTWIDNMGTGMMYMSGAYDGTAKTMELKGEMVDPMTGKNKPCRETFTVIDDNTRKIEMFDVTPDGKEYKSMEIVMTRKK